MLAAMRRPYSVVSYVELVNRIHRAMPHASIGSDMITGFPGETDDDVDASCTVLSDLPLSHLHVFPYSDRPGTRATSLADKVDGVVIRERGRRVRAIGEQMVRRFRDSQTGTSRRALTVDDGWWAVTDNYVKVKLDAQRPRNEWVWVTL